MPLGRTFYILGTDEVSTISTPVAVADLSFTPVASTRYYVEGVFLWRGVVPTAGCVIDLSVPTGLVDQCGDFMGGVTAGQSFAVVDWAHWGASDPTPLQLTGTDDSAYSWPILMRLWLETGPTPSGNVAITWRALSIGSAATLRAGSFLAVYRGYTNQ